VWQLHHHDALRARQIHAEAGARGGLDAPVL
jgi:hypothetical protein